MATASSGPAASSSTAIVQSDLADSLREDGRLLRMFVAREQHLKVEARELATRSWLIPESFYEEYLEAFVQKYAPAASAAADLDERTRELSDTFKGVLKSQESQSVEALEARLASCNGDVFKLRDTLLAAVKDLSSPRRFLGLGGGKPMTQEAILALKMAKQIRLRDVVMACLRGIWSSGIGGQVLSMAVENVRQMIEKFERTSDDVCTARGGSHWHQVKELLAEISCQEEQPEDETTGGSMQEGGAESSKSKRTNTQPEGKGTKALIEVALARLGGQATTQEIFAWVAANPEILGEHSRMQLNQKSREVKGKEAPIWHNTMRSILSHCFSCKRIPGRGYVYHLKDVTPTGPEALPLTDAAAAGEKASSRPRKASAAGAAGSIDTDGDAEAGAPKRKPKPRAKSSCNADSGSSKSRKRAAAAATGDPPVAGKRTRKSKGKEEDSALSRLLDSAINSAQSANAAASSSASIAAS